MIARDFKILCAVLGRQSAECAKLSDNASNAGDYMVAAFQSGAHLALVRALEYVKDAQAGILTEEGK